MSFGALIILPRGHFPWLPALERPVAHTPQSVSGSSETRGSHRRLGGRPADIPRPCCQAILPAEMSVARSKPQSLYTAYAVRRKSEGSGSQIT
jgi:hypothetical protein